MLLKPLVTKFIWLRLSPTHSVLPIHIKQSLRLKKFMCKFLYERKFPFLWDKCPIAQWPLARYLHFRVNVHNHQRLWVIFFLYILTSIWCCHYYFFILAVLLSVQRYLAVILICISLMATDTEGHFMWFSAICVLSPVKCLFMTFVHFLIGTFFES